MNHDLLASFRRDSGGGLDRLLTRSLTGLIAEGLLTLDEVTIDGTKTQARAGRSSLAQAEKLTRIETRVAEHVAQLKRELEADPSGPQRQRQERALRAAEEQEARLRRARATLSEREDEKRERAKTHGKAEAAKPAPSVSTSDPEARSMKMADGAIRLAWNVQVATARGFVVTIEPTDRRNDSGLAVELVAQIERRCGRPPARLLADGTAMTQDEIVSLAERLPGLTVYTPVPKEREDVRADTVRKRHWRRMREPDALRDWRGRMASEAGQIVYRRRKLTEHAHAKMKNRGFARVLVHGIAKVRGVCLLQALAHNLMHAHHLRTVLPVATPS